MKANPVCTRTEQKLRPFVAHKPCHTVHVGHVEREAIIYRRIITTRMPVFPNQSIVNGIDYVTIRDCPQRNGSSLRTDDASFYWFESCYRFHIRPKLDMLCSLR